MNKKYDIIIGNVVNDDVFKTVDMYFRKIWDKNRTIEELRYYKMNNQICIVNQSVLNSVLTFTKSYTLEEMTDHKQLKQIYKRNLETDIIEYLAERLNIDLREAMNKYYFSKLARQIEAGENGIENLDYKYLAEDLIETELK